MDYLIPVLGAAIIILALVLFVRTLFKQANDLYGTLTDENRMTIHAASKKKRNKSVDPGKPDEPEKSE